MSQQLTIVSEPIKRYKNVGFFLFLSCWVFKFFLVPVIIIQDRLKIYSVRTDSLINLISVL